MCDCIEKAEAQLNEEMIKLYPGREIIDPVELSPKFLYTKGYPLHFNCVGRVAYGKGVRKFYTYVVLNYCPFCGEKLEK